MTGSGGTDGLQSRRAAEDDCAPRGQGLANTEHNSMTNIDKEIERSMTDKIRATDRLTIDSVRDNIVGIDTQVPLLDGSHRPYVNFDNAASTPALRPVADTIAEFLDWYSSVHRGTGFKSHIATEIYDEAHKIVARFMGANPDNHTVIFVKNSTEALNKLARRLEIGPEEIVLTTLMEHHSNDLPWRAAGRIEHIGIDVNGALDEDHLDSLLKKHAGHVRLVAVTGASNVSGFINPIHRIAEKAHAAGAEMLVDAAQLAPHRAVDMRPVDDPGHIDYTVLSAHKMYAPFGTGALIGRKETFLKGDPDLVGGGTVRIVTTDEVDWTGLPDKEEAGSPNVVGAVALAKAILCMEEIGMNALAQHEAELTAHLLAGLAKIDGIQVFGLSDPARAGERLGVVPIAVEELDHHLVAAILSCEAGIGVRNGCFCAHPYLLRLLHVPPEKVEASKQAIRRDDRREIPGLIRVSFGCYNSKAEVDWFLEALAKITRHEYRGTYVQDPHSGEYTAEGFEPDLGEYFVLG